MHAESTRDVFVCLDRGTRGLQLWKQSQIFISHGVGREGHTRMIAVTSGVPFLRCPSSEACLFVVGARTDAVRTVAGGTPRPGRRGKEQWSTAALEAHANE